MRNVTDHLSGGIAFSKFRARRPHLAGFFETIAARYKPARRILMLITRRDGGTPARNHVAPIAAGYERGARKVLAGGTETSEAGM